MAISTVKAGKLEYLTADCITTPHCFATRLGGVSTGYLSSLNLGSHRGDTVENVEENFHILAQALHFDAQRLVLTRQTHSDIVRQVCGNNAQGLDNHAYPESDALITNDPGTSLAIFTADCTPILLHDPITGAVGAIHAGWRGTAANIAAKTVQAMVRAYGCLPKNICAAIGPNIGQCCFQTDSDVPLAMLETFGLSAQTYIQQSGGKYYVNLKALNALSLRASGVRIIDISTDCTACQPDRFWSHRRTGGQRGSQGAIIVCKGVSL